MLQGGVARSCLDDVLVPAGPFIDDVAPPAQKTLWFAVLYLFPTVGIAAGYIFGGLVGPALGWPAPFFIQASVQNTITFCRQLSPCGTLNLLAAAACLCLYALALLAHSL